MSPAIGQPLNRVDGREKVTGAARYSAEIVLPDMVLSRAEEAAREFATLKQHAHVGTKLRARAEALTAIRAGIDNMAAEFEV